MAEARSIDLVAFVFPTILLYRPGTSILYNCTEILTCHSERRICEAMSAFEKGRVMCSMPPLTVEHRALFAPSQPPPSLRPSVPPSPRPPPPPGPPPSSLLSPFLRALKVCSHNGADNTHFAPPHTKLPDYHRSFYKSGGRWSVTC